MKKSNAVKVTLSVVLLVGAGLILYRSFSQDDGISEKTFFYDLSEKKLFAASREELPPIRGLNNSEEVAVKAVVISTTANPKDKTSHKIVYLQKYAPELKQNLQKARAGQAEPMPRGTRNRYILVKRLDEAEWHSADTPEGEKILSEWNVPGSNGKYPAVCSP